MRRGTARPLVSVILPVRNGAGDLEGCLRSLAHLEDPGGGVEILVVDDGSNDHTAEVASAHPVHLCRHRQPRGPYSARNTGMLQARGEVLAFTDVDCRPEPSWLREGLAALEGSGAGLVGGRVRFSGLREGGVAATVDALLDLDVAASIQAHRACMTGNLFVRRTVVDDIGPFEEGLRSGGDMRWTRRATDRGHELIYAPRAVVVKRARRLRPLWRKQWRVGRGWPGVWSSLGWRTSRRLLFSLRAPLPPGPGRVRTALATRGEAEMSSNYLGIWCVWWSCKLLRALGAFRELCSHSRDSHRR